MAEGRVLPADLSPRAKCLLIGAGIRGRMANIAELATLSGQGKAAPFPADEAWAHADEELAELVRLLDAAGPECEVPERILANSPSPMPPDARITGLADAVRRRSRSDVRTLLLQFDGFYELLSREAVDPSFEAAQQ